MVRVIKALITLALVASAVTYFHVPLEIFARQAISQAAPCRVPITYTIASVDPRFKISNTELRDALTQATKTWETAAGRPLFSYVATGTAVIEVRLVYDARQETTGKLKQIGLSLSDDTQSYEALKTRYTSVYADYSQKKSTFDIRYAQLQKDAATYQSTVQRWNSRGGAPPAEAAQLDRERVQLDQRRAALVQLQNEVNAEADTVNTLVEALNRLARVLNQKVETYNTVGSTTGSEYEEGVFESRPGQETITIYEFDTKARLERVLAHEFGHALGLEHIEDPAAIMYRLNQSTNQSASALDIAELRRACRM